MKTISEYSVKALGLLTVFLFIGLTLPAASPAADYFCWIKAGNTDARITVRDMDRDGNPVSGSTWKGEIKSGQRQRIESKTGRISYSYARAVESRKRGANYNLCNNGNTIGLK